MLHVQKPIRIGNSRGARIPANLIRAYHLERGFVMKPVQGGILIEPAEGRKLSLEDSFAAMATDEADTQEALQWAETGLNDGLEEESGF